MIGEPWDRKPSTSSGALPTHTVALKSSWSDAGCVLVFLKWTVEMPQDGSGTRSGSAEAGGFARSGTAGADDSGRLCGRCAAVTAWPQHPDPFTTVSLTVAESPAAEMFSSRA